MHYDSRGFVKDLKLVKWEAVVAGEHAPQPPAHEPDARRTSPTARPVGAEG
jgi:hypothetical protein